MSINFVNNSVSEIFGRVSLGSKHCSFPLKYSQFGTHILFHLLIQWPVFIFFLYISIRSFQFHNNKKIFMLVTENFSGNIFLSHFIERLFNIKSKVTCHFQLHFHKNATNDNLQKKIFFMENLLVFAFQFVVIFQIPKMMKTQFYSVLIPDLWIQNEQEMMKSPHSDKMCTDFFSSLESYSKCSMFSD